MQLFYILNILFQERNLFVLIIILVPKQFLVKFKATTITIFRNTMNVTSCSTYLWFIFHLRLSTQLVIFLRYVTECILVKILAEITTKLKYYFLQQKYLPDFPVHSGSFFRITEIILRYSNVLLYSISTVHSSIHSSFY